jgi:ribokinase
MDLVIRTPRLPSPGETIMGADFRTAPGGKGANQSVGMAKLGAEVMLLGRVGKDDFGNALRESLVQANVNTRYVLDDAQAATGIAAIEVDADGQNTIVVIPGANARVTRADLDAARRSIESADTLVTQLEIPLDTVIYALSMAKAAGVATILNPAPAQPLAPEILSLADVVIPNEIEAHRLTDIQVDDWPSAEAAARTLNQQGAKAVVVTVGARGTIALENGRIYRTPAFQVPAVDATAAGDAFIAAFVVARLLQRNLENSLRMASAAGALATTKMGAQPSLPTRIELDEFLRSHDMDGLE